jgi:hypothetical protein
VAVCAAGRLQTFPPSGAIIPGMATVRLRKVSVFCLAILFLYYQMDRWAPLGAWNGEFRWPVHNDQFYVDIVIGLVLLWMIRSFYKRQIAGMWVSVALLTAWLGMEVKLWWIPYVKGTAPEDTASYSLYGSHTQILPAVGNHHPPDAGHTVLDLLLFVTWLVCALAAIRTRKRISWYIA